VEHLVQIDARTGDVTQWPIIEISLTGTPANLFAEIPVRNFRAAVPSALPDDLLDEHTIIHQPRRADAPTEDEDDSDVGSDERSFEDICSDLDALLNPLYATAYTRRLNTFPTHVLVQRCEPGSYGDDDDGVTYWDIPYTLGADQEPVLGTPVQVQRNETFTPVSRAFTLPLTFEANHLTRHVATFTASTKDFGERRYREGRMLSASNMQTISDVADGLDAHAQSLRDLHQRAMARQDEAARVAFYADPELRAGQIASLDL
jgi:hypothetical protein